MPLIKTLSLLKRSFCKQLNSQTSVGRGSYVNLFSISFPSVGRKSHPRNDKFDRKKRECKPTLRIIFHLCLTKRSSEWIWHIFDEGIFTDFCTFCNIIGKIRHPVRATVWIRPERGLFTFYEIFPCLPTISQHRTTWVVVIFWAVVVVFEVYELWENTPKFFSPQQMLVHCPVNVPLL